MLSAAEPGDRPAMMQHDTLQIVDSDVEIDADALADAPAREPVAGEVATHYADADPDVDLRQYNDHYSFPRFIDAVLDELDKEFEPREDARLVDDISGSDDVDFGLLLAFPDESLLFVGSDPTAKDAVPWFAFSIEPTEPVPAPEGAQDALDLLKPPRVRDLVETENWLPDRHGEWWLLPCDLIPAGTVFKPGVNSRPYGASPLGNHVPREYAFTVSDSVFLERFRDAVGQAPASIDTPPEVIDWTWRQVRKTPTPDGAPSWADIRHFAGDVLVRGTVRHRDDDHFVENLGDRWHLADTHDVEVYTGDAMAERVHLDYHGR